MTTGRAIVQTVFPGSNPSESLSLVSKEKPRPLPRNVVVRMIASAVNPIDLIHIRDGSLRRFEDKGAVHGSEGVGVVDEIGEGVTSCRVGERVIPLLFWKYYCDRGEGAWQDYVEVEEEDVVPVPDTMSDAVAAQFVINPWTMYGMLLDLQIPKGKYLLQTAAGSVLGRYTNQQRTFRILIRKHMSTQKGTRDINLNKKFGKTTTNQQAINIEKENIVCPEVPNGEPCPPSKDREEDTNIMLSSLSVVVVVVVHAAPLRRMKKLHDDETNSSDSDKELIPSTNPHLPPSELLLVIMDPSS